MLQQQLNCRPGIEPDRAGIEIIFHLVFGTRQAQAGEPAAARRFFRLLFFDDGCQIYALLLQDVKFFIQLRSFPGDLGTFQRDFDFGLAEFVAAFFLKADQIFSLFLNKGVGIQDIRPAPLRPRPLSRYYVFDFPAIPLIRQISSILSSIMRSVL